METFDVIIKTFYGLEEVLAEEVKAIGGKNLKVLKRAVSVSADLSLMYKYNLYLRTALRVLKPVMHFNAQSEKELYRRVKKFPWENYFDVTDTFAIDSVVNSEIFTHSKYVSLKVKDGIVDRFREKKGVRPSVDVVNPTIRFNLHVYGKECSISLDSSGDSLHKRGYRLDKTHAPLNEALAAGLILLTGWAGDRNFIDGMCGSGTLLIEAAMIAKNIAPNLRRKKFGFLNWKDFEKELWKEIKIEARKAVKDTEIIISGSDKSASAISIATENIVRSRLDDSIRIHQRDFFESSPSFDDGIVVMNPPYGERLKVEDMSQFYKSIGDTLKQSYNGFDAWIFSSNKDALKMLGLKTSKRITLYNGALETKFHKYSLYQGSKKNKSN